MPDTYPKTATLKEGTEVRLRLMKRTDGPKLLEFFRALPEEDRLFLKEDVTDKQVIDRWVEELDYERVLPVLAEVEDRIVGDASLHFQRERWSRHCGKIRCVVARDFQRKGLGTILAREIFLHAVQKGLEMILAEMMDTQIGAMKAFQQIGFRQEATLSDAVVDIYGKKHGLVIMANNVGELWRAVGEQIEAMGMDRSGAY